jgi:hypothetical protein
MFDDELRNLNFGFAKLFNDFPQGAIRGVKDTRYYGIDLFSLGQI